MKDLYLALVEALDQLGIFAYVDFNYGQLKETTEPSIAYPAALIKINVPSVEEHQKKLIEESATFEIIVVSKQIGDTNNLTSEAIRSNSLAYLDSIEAVRNALQGEEAFYSSSSISYKGATELDLRKGLKTIALRFEVSYVVQIASS